MEKHINDAAIRACLDGETVFQFWAGNQWITSCSVRSGMTITQRLDTLVNTSTVYRVAPKPEIEWRAILKNGYVSRGSSEKIYHAVPANPVVMWLRVERTDGVVQQVVVEQP